MELDIAAAEVALREERASIVHQMHELGATETGDLTGDVNYGDGFSDAGAATAERTEVMGVVDALKTQLEGVDAALERVEQGTYGTCATCGNEIGADRLEFRPSSIYCVSCKSSQR
jgi:RNA polymerase-binding transcription factor DksA